MSVRKRTEDFIIPLSLTVIESDHGL